MISIIKYPKPEDWLNLCQRPTFDSKELESKVRTILEKVKLDGDRVVLEMTAQFDAYINQLRVEMTEIEKQAKLIPQKLQEAIDQAFQNISKFHISQKLTSEVIETQPGVQCWRRSVGIPNVGLYIPGGTAPLFSTLLMLGIPAKLANTQSIVVCTPPNKQGSLEPSIAYILKKLGVEEVFLCGGAQAIGAMAYGTESIPKVDKIFGPGNQYVTMAKQLVQTDGVAIDMPAGPSEVLVIADEAADPEFVASDLLSQAEHGSDSQVMLVCTDEKVLKQTINEVHEQLKELPRKDAAANAIAHSKFILLEDSRQCMEFSNTYAPEHLIIATRNPKALAEFVINAGSVFLGKYSCESVGDYASGTNHTLPTNGYARAYSGVSLSSFQKQITFQQLSEEGIQNIGSTVEKMAAAEGLFAHKNAVTVRLNKLKK